MNELLLRIETLCWETSSSVLFGAGGGMVIVGLFLWLGGVRYSTLVIGVLGAAVGAVCGMVVSQKLGVDLLLGMLAGAVVLGVISVLVRNILIIVLATAIFALVGAGAYTSVILDTRPAESTPPDTPEAARTLSAEPQPLVQSFANMDPNSRQVYLERIAGPEPGFEARLKAILRDTWNAMSPHQWQLLGAILAGAIGGFLLIWFIKQVILPLCYSIVGTTCVLLGIQFLTLGVGFRAASSLPPQRWLMPVVFGAMSGIGWAGQLWAARKSGGKAPKADRDDDD